MWARGKGLLKACWYQIRYGKAIRFEGPPVFDGKGRINLKRGRVKIGKGLIMKNNAYLAIMNGGALQIGHGCSIARNSAVICHDHITIGDFCAIAPNVLIYDHDHKFGFEGIKEGFDTAPVVIGKHCWIGAGTIILRGTHIGEGSVIGAGCVVKGDIPAHSLVTQERQLKIVRLEKD